MSEPYRQGYELALAMESYTNPYRFGTVQYEEFQDGYSDGVLDRP